MWVQGKVVQEDHKVRRLQAAGGGIPSAMQLLAHPSWLLGPAGEDLLPA